MEAYVEYYPKILIFHGTVLALIGNLINYKRVSYLQSMKIMIVILEIETINPFVPNAPFLYPLKISENRKVFLCFHGDRERVHWVRMA